MSFPTNGINHHAAIKSEKNFYKFEILLENFYNKKISKIIHLGGTSNKTDVKLIFTDGSEKQISLKTKKNIKNGSFDYVNTSDFGDLSEVFNDTFSIFKECKSSKKISDYSKLVKQISEDLSKVEDKLLTDLFKEKVLKKYENLDLTIIDEKTNTLYNNVLPKVFQHVNNGGLIRLVVNGKNTMSSKVIGIFDNSDEIVDLNLRFRVHLNNGKSKWLGLKKGSSSLVFKFQQDKVYTIV